MGKAIVPAGGRGCGDRKKGGVYSELGVTNGLGLPIEHFLVDPPQGFTPDEYISMGLMNADGSVNAIGVQLFPYEGHYHIMDVVGEEYYPNITDFVEEARRFGVSRRLELSPEQYAKLDGESMHFLLHRRAIIQNTADYWNQWIRVPITGYKPCPKELPEHKLVYPYAPDKNTWITPDAMCAGLWWNDIEGGEPYPHDSLPFQANPRLVVRKMPSFEYRAVSRPMEEIQEAHQEIHDGNPGRVDVQTELVPIKSEYSLGIFMKFKPTRLVVINDNGEKSQKRFEEVSKSKLIVEMEDE